MMGSFDIWVIHIFFSLGNREYFHCQFKNFTSNYHLAIDNAING